MRYKKSEGLTKSEEILSSICERSFLSLWTYPNLFRKAGKELADLIVVFGDDILIFSDKSIVYPHTDNPKLNWSRWFRAAIKESAEQVWKAEHCIRKNPIQVFLDGKATEPLPLKLPSASDMRFHGICVVSGASERCHELTGRPTLSLNTQTVDDGTAFSVGRITNQRGWVHVFDEYTLSRLLAALSTTKDFIEYLRAKERLLNDGLFQGAECELDILGYYLWHDRKFPEQNGPFQLKPNLWSEVCANAQFRKGLEKNKISFFWDRLIEHLTSHYLNETLEFGNELEMSEWEILVRLMASETRFYRRVLSEQIIQRVDSVRAGKQSKIGTILPSENIAIQYVLLVGSGSTEEDHAAYREDRAKELQLRCFAAKAARPESRYFVGIALDGKKGGGGSEDFCLIDTAGWDEQNMAHAQKIREELSYFLPGKTLETNVKVDEYPED
ncbi:hypothetical protein [Pannonibacter phragmitetus]|uniref:Uncharacterized protein n=1 Tax=Pannonibacter phragmitetus TaxID=121719 RepID=A0A0U3PQU9_9HYPH|nr:hypothetical protein [Pannonibacter phragmitetus]ALV26468.1 hypothetical protein APZ00_04725 [Pannonibacter phragmitetus]